MSRLALVRSPVGRVVVVLCGVLLAGVAIGLVAMWPRGEVRGAPPLAVGDIDAAEAVAVRGSSECQDFAGPGCRLIEIRLLSGRHEGERSFLTLPRDPLAPPIEPGDRIQVAQNVPSGLDPELGGELPIDEPSANPYAFIDFERTSALLWLAIAFAAIVAVLGRWQGLRALVGLGLALFLVVEFVVPAILDGHPPLLVALVGALAVMAVTMLLTHGANLKSAAAMLGTTIALLLICGLAVLAVHLANITGFSGEESTLLAYTASEGLSLEGLVIAGIVVGALGVLDDVTISQASTVLALRRAAPTWPFRRLFTEALTVGRDHLGATVNTLVLAYAGATLPVLLIFANQRTAFGTAVNREPVAEEIVAGLVGSIGLIAAVPLTTALAALLARRLPDEALGDTGSAHVH